MSKIIAFSLFGYNKEKHQDGFDFNSFLRGLSINIRLATLLYPDWRVYCAVDKVSHEAYKNYFDGLKTAEIAEIEVLDKAPLCQGMLWRLRPIFEFNASGYAKHSHVICRDLDSPLTYKERLCVQEWMNNGKCAHAIADSESHNIKMMGGMVGFMPKHFTLLTSIYNFEELISRGKMDLSGKGSDQTLMMNVIYPCVAKPGEDSITQHYLQGIGHTFLSDCHNTVPEIDLKPHGVPDEMKEAWCAPHMGICGHIGAAGHYSPACEKFLRKYTDRFTSLKEIEANHPDLFYWVKTGEI